jgi:AcrR family transcriptional regulator
MAKRSNTSAANIRPRASRAKGSADAIAAKSVRRRNPEHRPGQILEAALHVFGERGLANARLDDIAKRAGLAKGTIYLYFPNKEELFRAVVRSTLVAAIERAELLSPEESPEEQLDVLMRTHWTFLRSPTFERMYRLVIGELHDFPELARFYSEEVILRACRLLTSVLRRGVESGAFRSTDPEATARMILATFVSHAIWRSRPTVFLHTAHVSDETVFSQIRDFIFTALQPNVPAIAHPPAHRASRTRK